MTAIQDDAEPCDVCGARASFSPHLTVSMTGTFDAEIRRCGRCGFRQVRPRLARQELDGLYAQDYFDPDVGMGLRNYAVQQQRFERQAYFLAKRLRRIGKQGRLLEVGCALGFLLEGLKRWTSWEVEGLDVGSFAAAYARRAYGLKVKCATLEEAGYPDGRFDFVIQKDVLEHVLRPRDHLMETCRILRPGGQVWLITPNGEANLRPMRRFAATLRASADARLPLLDQGHLSFFSKRNLLRLVSECGFECVRFRNIGLKRGLRSLGYLPKKRRPPQTAPGGRPRGRLASTTPSTPAPAPEDQDELFERMSAGIEGYRRRVRSWRAYFYFRQFLKSFGTLPGPFTLGRDFDLILKKR